MHDPITAPTDDGTAHTTRCKHCGYTSGKPADHTYDETGECTVCHFKPVAKDNDGNLYDSLQIAFETVKDGGTITLTADITPSENITFGEYYDDETGKWVKPGYSVTLVMDGHTLYSTTTDPALTVSGGSLTIADAATITAKDESGAAAVKVEDGNLTFEGTVNATGSSINGYSSDAAPAILVTGGKVTFEGNVAAKGGLQGSALNLLTRFPAIKATGGELDFRGTKEEQVELDLLGGLTLTGDAKLTYLLTKGTFYLMPAGSTGSLSGYTVSVTGSTYKLAYRLLADGYAFAVSGTESGENIKYAGRADTEGSDVTIISHTHFFDPKNNYTCKCNESCTHPEYKDGKCAVCGKPCEHGTDDPHTDGSTYCGTCGQRVFARIKTGKYTYQFFTDLVTAMDAVTDDQTIELIDDVDNSNKYAILTGENKTVTLDLKGHTINGGWMQVGIDRNWNNYTSSTLKVSGTGSIKTSGNLSVGYSATLDLSGWTGGENGEIAKVGLQKNGKIASNPESLLIVGEKTGTIGVLGFYSWPSEGVKTKLNGGSYGEVSIVVQYNSEPFGSLLAPGYAFQYVDSGKFVEYTKTATNRGNTISNVKVVKCPHEKIENGTCAYCGKTGIAATLGTEVYSESNLYQAFADWQVEDGATLTLHQDCSLSAGAEWARVNGAFDLNGHTLTMAENTSIEVSGGSSVMVVDNSANGGGKIDGRVWVSWGSLTLESGEITSLDAENSPDGAIKLRGGKVTSSASGDSGTVLVYRLLEDGCYLEGSALLAAFSGGPYEVKSAHIAVSGEKTGKIAIGKNIVNIPVSLTLADTSTTAVQFDWYRVGTDKNDLSKLASQTAAVTDGTAAYDPATAEKSTEAGWDSLVQDTDYTLVCMATGMAGAEVSWQAVLTGYTLHMLPPSLEDAEITFAEGWQKKTFWPDPDNNSVGKTEISSGLGAYTVTLGGKTLTEGTDYTVSGNVAAAIGTQELVITGKAPNYSGTKTAQWEVVPHALKMLEIKQSEKQYDGTVDLPDGAFSEYFNSNDGYGQITLREGTDYVVTEARFDTPDASSENKGYRYTVELKNPNYVFADGTRVHTAVYGEDARTSVSITKAAAPTAEPGALEVVNRHAASYTFDLSALLSAAPVGEYGTISYGAPTLTLSGIPHTTQTSVNSETGALTLTVDNLENDSTGKVGTITVTVTTQNYKDIPLTVELSAVNKIIPTGKPTLSKTTLAWDEALDTITLSGTMRDEVNGKDVTGTFAWDGTNIINGIGRFPMTWTFTPDDETTYTKAGGFSEIEIVKATPSGEPKHTAITASGKTLADAVLAVNENWPEGTVQWVDENGTELDVSAEVKANTAYRWRFAPTDTDHYNEASGTITLYVVSHGGSGGSSSAPTYPVNTPAKAEGGTVSASPRNAKKGDTVIITVKPDSGYELGGLTVTDKDGNSLKLTAKGNGQYTFTMPEGKVDIQPSFKALAEGVFSDVTASAYYYDAVKWAAEQGITGGIGNGLFGPYRPCTRGQIVTFLWRAAGSPEPKNAVSLTDVPADAYYAKAVAWAMENGITLGTTDTTFSPDAACTRAQSVTFLYRAANASASDAAAFMDVPSGSYYADAVKWAVDNGVTNGTTDTTFSPDTGCTRAQIVTFLWRQRKAG